MRKPLNSSSFCAAVLGIVFAWQCAIGVAAQSNAATRSKLHGSSFGGATLAEIAESQSMVDTWRDYALSTLQANFSWASEPDRHVEVPSIFNRGHSSLARDPVIQFPGSSIEDGTKFHIAMQSTRVAETPLYVSAESTTLLPDYSPGLRRTVIAPSLTQHLSETNSFKVSAIFAYQRVSGFDLVAPQNMPAWLEAPVIGSPNPPLVHGNESSSGVGVRADFLSVPTKWLSWTAGYQSRVSMGSFNTYQGLYGRPGSFDIPPSANFSVALALTSSLKLNLGVERVMYSQTTPFVSQDLPLLTLLALQQGRFSPKFEWEDLNVRSVGLLWHGSILGDVGMRLFSREQPLPQALLLAQPFAPYLSSRNWEFDYARAFGKASSLQFNASYAPIQLWNMSLGDSLTRTDGVSQLRYEMLWTTAF